MSIVLVYWLKKKDSKCSKNHSIIGFWSICVKTLFLLFNRVWASETKSKMVLYSTLLFDSLAQDECFSFLPWVWLFKLCGQRLFRNSLPHDTPQAGLLFWPCTQQTFTILTIGTLLITNLVQEEKLPFHLFHCFKLAAMGQHEMACLLRGLESSH